MIRTVIIDDEDHVKENLKKMVATHFDSIEIVGEGSGVDSALKIIKQEAPDLVFMDIDLSDGSGFNVLDQLDTINFKLIFITAYNEHALKAFRYSALDYLLKPINVEELGDAISKVGSSKEEDYITRTDLENAIKNNRKNDEDKKLAIRNLSGIQYVKVSDIISCEADGNYTTISLLNGEQYIASKPLKEYVDLLPKDLFFRPHQSHLINVKSIKQFSKNDGGYITLENNAEIPVARRRREELLKKLDQLIYSKNNPG